jgi:hypothetical protein
MYLGTEATKQWALQTAVKQQAHKEPWYLDV